MSLLFEPGRLKLTLDDVRATVETKQLDALFRLVNMTVGPEGVWTVEGPPGCSRRSAATTSV
jgi:hypothetical protein